MLLSLIRHQQQNIDRIYLYIKDSFQSKYQLLLFNRRGKVRIKQRKNLKEFIDYSQKINLVYENLYYDPRSIIILTKKRKVFIVFDDKIVDMEANWRLIWVGREG